MRSSSLFLCLACLLFLGCDTLGIGTRDQSADPNVAASPTAEVVDTIRYNPADSPTPMTASTPLPVPGQAAPPATYSTKPTAPAPAPTNTNGGYVPNETTPLNAPPGAPPTYTNTTTADSMTYPTNPAMPESYGYPPTEVPFQYGQQQQARGAAPATYSAAAAQIAPFLAGNWANSADPRETVQFTPTHYYTYYDGQLLVEEDMTFHPQCPGECSGGGPAEFACFSISGPAGTDCYGIIRLTPQVLELSMLGVSTETIVYNKVQ